MDEQDQLTQQIAAAVSEFQKTQMAVSCESVAVDFHDETLVVTLTGTTSPAERNYARDPRARELLERFYHQLFEVIKPILETRIQEITQRQVRRSRLDIDPESGTGVILAMLTGERCPD